MQPERGLGLTFTRARCDLAEVRVLHVRVGGTELNLVERVEGLEPEFHVEALGEAEGLEQSSVERAVSRTVYVVRSRVAACQRGGNLERGGVEPLCGATAPGRRADALPSNVGRAPTPHTLTSVVIH